MCMSDYTDKVGPKMGQIDVSQGASEATRAKSNWRGVGLCNTEPGQSDLALGQWKAEPSCANIDSNQSGAQRFGDGAKSNKYEMRLDSITRKGAKCHIRSKPTRQIP